MSNNFTTDTFSDEDDYVSAEHSTAYMLSGEAYTKIILHAAKYPHHSVNGILVGTPVGQGYRIEDAFPLFHQAALTPMLEMACTLIDTYCQEKGWGIVGYYHGNELMCDLKVHPAAKCIADKIEANCSRACMLMVRIV